MPTPRGIRNNNPLNIRHSRDRFQGEVVPSRDGAFKQFSSMAYGYRAAFVTLATYLECGNGIYGYIIDRYKIKICRGRAVFLPPDSM